MTRIETIVSGGQTGADRAALDFAIMANMPHGGWCPKGRKAEDGPIPAQYELQETTRADYLQRTEWNVRDSDGTVIFTLAAELNGGSKRTADFAQKHRKPWIHLTKTDGEKRCVERLKAFVTANDVRVLNVAGSRGSKEPLIWSFVITVLALATGKHTAETDDSPGEPSADRDGRPHGQR